MPIDDHTHHLCPPSKTKKSLRVRASHNTHQCGNGITASFWLCRTSAISPSTTPPCVADPPQPSTHSVPLCWFLPPSNTCLLFRHPFTSVMIMNSKTPGKKDETCSRDLASMPPVRHMQFDPRSYHLCIASEAGICIVNTTSPDSRQE
jgi:hypothetical protein